MSLPVAINRYRPGSLKVAVVKVSPPSSSSNACVSCGPASCPSASNVTSPGPRYFLQVTLSGGRRRRPARCSGSTASGRSVTGASNPSGSPTVVVWVAATPCGGPCNSAPVEPIRRTGGTLPFAWFRNGSV